MDAYKEAQQILARELPVLPLASSLRLQAYRYDMKGTVLSPFGNASFAGVSRENTEEVKSHDYFYPAPSAAAADHPLISDLCRFQPELFHPSCPTAGRFLWNAWLFWFEGVLHWDFGVSSINGQLISEQLREVFPATMELCILAFGFALLIGIPVGMIAGVMRNKWPDT